MNNETREGILAEVGHMKNRSEEIVRTMQRLAKEQVEIEASLMRLIEQLTKPEDPQK